MVLNQQHTRAEAVRSLEVDKNLLKEATIFFSKEIK
jgi:hypothetical protein